MAPQVDKRKTSHGTDLGHLERPQRGSPGPESGRPWATSQVYGTRESQFARFSARQSTRHPPPCSGTARGGLRRPPRSRHDQHRQRAHGHLDRRPPVWWGSRSGPRCPVRAAYPGTRRPGVILRDLYRLAVGGDGGADRVTTDLIGLAAVLAANEIGVTVLSEASTA